MSELMAYIDGACQPTNPGGIATFGVAVWEDDRYVYKDKGVVGKGSKMSNNVGEYAALIRVLQWYRDKIRSGRYMTVRADSKLVINQMNGKWRIRSGLYLPYYNKARELILGYNLQSVLAFEWVPREENIVADKLAEEAYYAR